MSAETMKKATIIPPHQVEFCESKIGKQTAHLRTKRGDSQSVFCKLNASYSIDGKNYCSRHAEITALNILLDVAQGGADNGSQ
jgi:hypothetical protein